MSWALQKRNSFLALNSGLLPLSSGPCPVSLQEAESCSCLLCRQRMRAGTPARLPMRWARTGYIMNYWC